MFNSARKCPSLQLLISIFLSVSLVLLGISTASASSSSTTWDKLYGGTLDDTAAAIVQTSDGSYIIAGTTYSFGAGSADFWLIKTDKNGIIPEFPSWIIMPLFMVATLSAVMVYRRLTKKAFKP